MILIAHRRIWTFYLLTVSAIVLSVTVVAPASVRGGQPYAFLALHGALLIACLVVDHVARGRKHASVAAGACSFVGLPLVFLSLAWVLPAVHPEPWEWRWLLADRTLFGTDPTVWLQRVLWPPFTELMQLCYGVFYLVPIATIVAAGALGGVAAFDRAQIQVVLGFQLSYVGYLIWPTLPPYRFLFHEKPIEGVLFAEQLHAALDAAELHRWNCFPSGHTMLSVLSLVVAWRVARPAFWVLLPIVAVLVFSTVALRYHYVVDVLAGLVGVPFALWVAGRVMRVPAERRSLPAD